MNMDFAFGLYVFCMDYHGGQGSRLYRLMFKLRVKLSDTAIHAIQGNRHTRKEHSLDGEWAEWETSRRYYRELKRSKLRH